MSIYIHIPFCNTICNYCDFCKVIYDKKYIRNYLDSLKKEIELRYKSEKVHTIYIGGGTPTSLDEEELRGLLEITKLFNMEDVVEFTIEGNIESITEGKLRLMKEYGVNRISLGVESFDDEIIKILGRGHTRGEVFEKIELVKKYFDNINIDLMYAVTEDIQKVKSDIMDFLALDINHVSCYSLIIEDNTRFKIEEKQNIDSDIDFEMYKCIESLLENDGYNHYEISNYAREGYESKHNLVYWNNEEYYGFGLGSVSFINNKRICNTKNLSSYLKGNYVYEEVFEDTEVQMENEIFLGLRKLMGINLEVFRKKYGKGLEDIYDFGSLIDNGYLEMENGFLRVNRNYIYIQDEIVVKLLSSRY